MWDVVNVVYFMRLCILLTACINPAGMMFTHLQDAQIRKEQYVSALKFYLGLHCGKIVFAENSNTDISYQFRKEIVNNQIEFLIFKGNKFDPELGKGYGEAEIIEHAINHSHFIRESDYVIKVTGRLIPINFKLLFTDFKIYRKFDIIASYVCRGLMDSRIIIAKPEFWEKVFLPKRHRLNDSKNYYFEHLLEECIKEVAWRPFLLTLPSFDGISGTFGSRIENLSWKSKDYWRKLWLNWKYYQYRKNG